MPATELAALKSAAHCRTFSAHEDVLTEDTRSDLVYLLVRGSAMVTQWTQKRDIILCFTGKGDIVGDISALDNCPHTATVTTLERSDCIYWPAETFLRCLQHAPLLALNLARINQRRLRQRGVQMTGMAVL